MLLIFHVSQPTPSLSQNIWLAKWINYNTLFLEGRLIFALLTMVCLAVSLAACGGSATQEETTSDTTAETTTSSDASDSDLLSLEESFAADGEEVQSMLDAMQAQYEDQGISVKLYAEGDEMHYDFTIDSVVTTEETRPELTEALKAGTEASAISYYELAKTVKESVSNDVVIVVLTFFDGEGNELYTQSFSSAEEAAAE